MILVAMLGGGTISGCLTTGDGEQSIEAIEAMTDQEYNKWKLYWSLGVKIGANRLITENVLKIEEVELIAVTLETVRDQSVVPGATSIIQPALEDAGLTNDEVQLLFLVVEQELLARGALSWIDPDTGLVALSPRTKELLTLLADNIRSVTTQIEERPSK